MTAPAAAKREVVNFGELMESERAGSDSRDLETAGAVPGPQSPQEATGAGVRRSFDQLFAEKSRMRTQLKRVALWAARRAPSEPKPGVVPFDELLLREQKRAREEACATAPGDADARIGPAEDDGLFWGSTGAVFVSATGPARARPDLVELAPPRVPLAGRRTAATDWLVRRFEREFGPGDWDEFTATTAGLAKADMVRSLLSVARDHAQAARVSDEFFQAHGN